MADHLDDLKSVSAAWKRAQRLGAEAEKRREPVETPSEFYFQHRPRAPLAPKPRFVKRDGGEWDWAAA